MPARCSGGDGHLVRDGTVGNPDISFQPIRDPVGVVEIGESFGNRPGGGVNLFHSFSTFDVGVWAIRHCSRPIPLLPTSNVIARVAGTTPSTIDGTLASSVDGAALYFLNPNGVVFGASARIDVPGALHVATASTLAMLPDDPDGALTFTGDVRLGVAQPSTFGFLDRPVTLAVEGSTLDAAPGSVLSLVGHDVRIGPGAAAAASCGAACLRAPGGSIRVAAVGNARRVPVNLDAFVPGQTGEALIVAPNVLIDARGNRTGRLAIRGGNVRLGAARLRADVARVSGSAGRSDRHRRRRAVARRRNADRRNHGRCTSYRHDQVVCGYADVVARCHVDDRTLHRLHGRSRRQHRARRRTLLDARGASVALSTQTANALAAGNIELNAAQVRLDGTRISSFTTGRHRRLDRRRRHRDRARQRRRPAKCQRGARWRRRAAVVEGGGGSGGGGAGRWLRRWLDPEADPALVRVVAVAAPCPRNRAGWQRHAARNRAHHCAAERQRWRKLERRRCRG